MRQGFARIASQKDFTLKFIDLGLDRPLLSALEALGHDTPTPIQVKAIPTILDGRDVVGLAQTGTGKTGAFSLPLLQRLAASSKGRPAPKTVRALILSPTRELAAQIHQSVRDYSKNLKLNSMVVFGGVSIRPQIANAARGVDVMIATPGRLLDLIDQKAVSLHAVETLILDEADQMLDIGFLPAIRRIIGLVPGKRQTLLFSATMPKEIRKLAADHLDRPVEIAVTPAATPVERIAQSVMHIGSRAKPAAVAHLAGEHHGKRVIIFTRTKHGADRVVKSLDQAGFAAAAIHGNKSQNNRVKALAAFKDGSCPLLVATDIAARGIDVPGVELVINYDLPNVPEVYVHRIGRTARAGASGLAVSLVSGEDRSLLRDIERLIKRQLDVVAPPAGLPVAMEGEEAQAEPRRHQQKQKPRSGAGAATKHGAKAGAGMPGRPNRRRRRNRGGKPQAKAA
jgi:ATP-dependent RNA helicase RhlE